MVPGDDDLELAAVVLGENRKPVSDQRTFDGVGEADCPSRLSFAGCRYITQRQIRSPERLAGKEDLTPGGVMDSGHGVPSLRCWNETHGKLLYPKQYMPI